MTSSYAVEKEKMVTRVIELERETREERGRVEAENHQQLTDLNRRLQDMIDASSADQARVEQEVEEERHRAQAGLADLNRRLQDATSASAANLALLEQEREQALAEHNQQLVDLAHHLRDETDASAAHRTKLEEEVKELRDRLPTA